jgi:uncharacterized coiled-coil DUF342 family protein
MGGGAGVSAKTCKCCGGNGWEGSNCEATRRENDRLWREYEEGLDRINNQRREILSQAKELDTLVAQLADAQRQLRAAQRRIAALETQMRREGWTQADLDEVEPSVHE